MAGKSCLVLLSGGQDSTTCLYVAKHEFETVHALTINYGQRHRLEVEAAKKVAQFAGVASHEILEVGKILKGTSPLVNDFVEVGHYASTGDLPGGIEPTFIPARNILFLTIAANRAAVLGVKDIVTGVCEEDYGGYPDCRKIFIEEMARVIGLGLTGEANDFKIHTPLMHLTKKQTVQLAETLPGCIEALSWSHTCYNGEYPPNPNNHASLLRARGFHEAGVADPLIVRAIKEGKLPTDYPTSGLVEGTKFNTLQPA